MKKCVKNPIKEKLKKLQYIETEHFYLRPLTMRDAEDLFEFASDEHTSEYLLWAPHPDLDFTKRYLKRLCEMYEKNEFFDYAVFLKSEKKVIGTGGYSSIDESNNAAEIGYVLNPRYWGRGYATEIAEELIAYAFDVLKIHRVFARYISENLASRKVMEHCGMQYEGTQRGQLYVKERYCDIGYCSILREEYYFDHQIIQHKTKFSTHWYDGLW